jgi:hypothetical protein
MKKLAKGFQELIEDKNYYSREWKEGNKWSFNISTKKEPWSLSLANTRQVKLKKVVEGNKEEDQTTTPIILEIINSSRRNSFDGTKDGLKSCKDKKERRTKTSSKDHHKGWCKKLF